MIRKRERLDGMPVALMSFAYGSVYRLAGALCLVGTSWDCVLRDRRALEAMGAVSPF